MIGSPCLKGVDEFGLEVRFGETGEKGIDLRKRRDL